MVKAPKYKTKAAHPEPVGEPKINLIYSLGVAPSSSPWAWPTFMVPSWIFLSTIYMRMTRLYIRV